MDHKIVLRDGYSLCTLFAAMAEFHAAFAQMQPVTL